MVDKKSVFSSIAGNSPEQPATAAQHGNSRDIALLGQKLEKLEKSFSKLDDLDKFAAAISSFEKSFMLINAKIAEQEKLIRNIPSQIPTQVYDEKKLLLLGEKIDLLEEKISETLPRLEKKSEENLGEALKQGEKTGGIIKELEELKSEISLIKQSSKVLIEENRNNILLFEEHNEKNSDFFSEFKKELSEIGNEVRIACEKTVKNLQLLGGESEEIRDETRKRDNDMSNSISQHTDSLLKQNSLYFGTIMEKLDETIKRNSGKKDVSIEEISSRMREFFDLYFARYFLDFEKKQEKEKEKLNVFLQEQEKQIKKRFDEFSEIVGNTAENIRGIGDLVVKLGNNRELEENIQNRVLSEINNLTGQLKEENKTTTESMKGLFLANLSSELYGKESFFYIENIYKINIELKESINKMALLPVKWVI